MADEMLETWRTRFIKWLESNWIHKDSAHDLNHLNKVWRNCLKIAAGESQNADLLTLLAATYFHDLVTLPKNHSEREKASLLSAEQTSKLIADNFQDFPKDKIEGVFHAIHAHSFSANVDTKTIEARILQDADRMEALGAIGIARLFYTAGRLNASLYNNQDPLGTNRTLDDKQFALDHIEVKLLQLPGTMKTKTGRELAAKEAEFIRSYRTKFLEEI